ncbi:MAG: hypothetical protein RRZ67_03110 [Victivallaceae bacterium]
MSISGINDGFSHVFEPSEVSDINQDYITDGIYEVGVVSIEEMNRSVTETIEKKLFKRSLVITLFAGISVLAVAVAVSILATTFLIGAPQTIVLGIALAGITTGGVTVIRSIVDLTRLLIKKDGEEDNEKYKFARAAGIGLGIFFFGFILKLVASSMDIPHNEDGSMDLNSPAQPLLANTGNFAGKMGMSALFSALSGLLFGSLSSKGTEESSDVQDQNAERKRIIVAAAIVLTVGVGLTAIGIVLLIFGTTALGGIPQMIALAFAPPLIATGITLILKMLIGAPLQEIKDYLKNRKNRNENAVDIEVITDNPILDKEGTIITESQTMQTHETVKTTDNRNDDTSVFNSNQKIIMVLTGIIALIGIALLILSSTAGLAGFQVILLTTVGGSALAFSLPVVLSGLIQAAVKLKMRAIESRINRKRMVMVLDGKIIKPSKLMTLNDNALTRLKYVNLDNWAIENRKRAKTEGYKMGVIFGIISALLGITLILLPLIPVVTPFVAGIVALATPFMLIGIFLILGNLIDYWKERMKKIHDKRLRAERKLNDLLLQAESNFDDLALDLDKMDYLSEAA